jgi:hypothetical protein
MFKKIIFLLVTVLPNALFAYDCSQYKYDTDIDIKLNIKDVKIHKSDKDMVGKLGYTKPEISYSAMAHTVIIPVHGGYCASLRGIDVEIVEDFDVIIDKRLKEKSCAYDIVYKHEQDHVDIYKNVIKNNIDKIKKSVNNVAKEFKPVFIKSEKEVPDFSEKINKSDFVEKIKADIVKEITEKNEEIDERGDSFYIWKCDDFYKKMKNSDIVID